MGFSKHSKELQLRILEGNETVYSGLCGCLFSVSAEQTFHSLPFRPISTLAIPHHIWEELSLDFIEGLPKSENYDSILVVVDRLSKYAHFLGFKHPYTEVAIAAVFAKEIVRLHGITRTVVSDRDKISLSKFWENSFDCKVQHFVLVLLIILNLMAKLQF